MRAHTVASAAPTNWTLRHRSPQLGWRSIVVFVRLRVLQLPCAEGRFACSEGLLPSPCGRINQLRSAARLQPPTRPVRGALPHRRWKDPLAQRAERAGHCVCINGALHPPLRSGSKDFGHIVVIKAPRNKRRAEARHFGRFKLLLLLLI